MSPSGRKLMECTCHKSWQTWLGKAVYFFYCMSYLLCLKSPILLDGTWWMCSTSCSTSLSWRFYNPARVFLDRSLRHVLAVSCLVCTTPLLRYDSLLHYEECRNRFTFRSFVACLQTSCSDHQLRSPKDRVYFTVYIANMYKRMDREVEAEVQSATFFPIAHRIFYVSTLRLQEWASPAKHVVCCTSLRFVSDTHTCWWALV